MPSCVIVQWNEAFRTPTAVEVLKAIGAGATGCEIETALKVDFWILSPVLKDMERHRLIRRVPRSVGMSDMILPNELLQ